MGKKAQAEMEMSVITQIRPPAKAHVSEAKSPKTLGVVDQIKFAFSYKNALGTFIGVCIGGFIPFATYLVSHTEIQYSLHGFAMLMLVLGSLVFSAKTVWQWSYQAFDSDAWKATGFVVILEGVMTLSEIQYLAVAALVLLTGINAIATGVILSSQRSKS